MGQGEKINADTIFRHIFSSKFPVLLARKCCQQVAIKILSCWKVTLASVRHTFCGQAIKLTSMLIIPSGWIGGGKTEFGLRLSETMEIRARQGPAGWGFPGELLANASAETRGCVQGCPQKPSCSYSFLLFSTKTVSMYILYKYTELYWRRCPICTFQFFFAWKWSMDTDTSDLLKEYFLHGGFFISPKCVTTVNTVVEMEAIFQWERELKLCKRLHKRHLLWSPCYECTWQHSCEHSFSSREHTKARHWLKLSSGWLFLKESSALVQS